MIERSEPNGSPALGRGWGSLQFAFRVFDFQRVVLGAMSVQGGSHA